MQIDFVELPQLGDRFIFTASNGSIIRITFWIPQWWKWRFEWLSTKRFKELTLPTMTIDLEQNK